MKKYALVLSTTWLKLSPKHTSENVSQLLFGQIVETIIENHIWVLVNTVDVYYQGYVQKNHLIELDDNVFTTFLQSKEKYFAGFDCYLLDNRKNKIFIPYGSPLPFFKNSGRTFEIEQLERCFLKGQVIKIPVSLQEIIEDAKRMVGIVPYVWAGCSNIHGLDCSGFVQVLFRLLGIILDRDAYQQAKQGVPVDNEDYKIGDLLFFKNLEGKIIHVGILFGYQAIIHASEVNGYVAIDSFDGQHIIDSKTSDKTHTFALARRFF